MICAHCAKSFAIDKIQHQRGKGFNAQIQCPLCGAWLARNATLARLKMLGFYVGLISILYSYFEPDIRSIGIPVSIFAVMLLLVSHMMDHLKVIEAPEKPDDSAHRQKYR